MAGRDAYGRPDSPGSRQSDRTVDDALRTMERLAVWLEVAKEENAWKQIDDQIQVAMLHGMLTHLKKSIEELLEVGGEDVEELVRNIQALVAKET